MRRKLKDEAYACGINTIVNASNDYCDDICGMTTLGRVCSWRDLKVLLAHRIGKDKKHQVVSCC